MADLRVTPTRLALLRGVAAGEVFRRMDVDNNPIDFHRYRRVTKRCAAVASAGWIILGEVDDDSWSARTPWRLTAAGQAVLDAHPKES